MPYTVSVRHMIKEVPSRAQDFYSIGSLGSFAGSVGGAKLVAVFLKSISPIFDIFWVPLVASFVIIYLVAYFVPQNEPHKVTSEEAFVGFFNSILVYFAVQGIPV